MGLLSILEEASKNALHFLSEGRIKGFGGGHRTDNLAPEIFKLC